jgi:glycosyltransferase 2 family protein
MSVADASTRRVGLPRWLPVLLSLAAFAYLFSIVDIAALVAAMRGVPPRTWLGALLLGAASLSAGVLRWWLLFHAFGAEHPPRLFALVRHYATGFFYNTYLPGGLLGDVARGVAVQRAFAPGSAGGFATVVVERACGLSALLAVVAAATLLHPRLGLERFQARALAVFAFGLVTLLGIASLGRLARIAPSARLRGWLAKLPVPRAYAPLVAAWLISLICQVTPALAGHVLLAAIHPPPSLFDSLAIVPIASAAAFLPFSVSGAGIREAVFVQLYAQVGIPSQASLAAALCLWATQILLAGLCGVYVMLSQR